MSHVLLAALLVASATATAQTSPQTPVPESGTPASAAPATPAPAAAAPEGELSPEMQRELDRRLEAARKEMQEEIRAQMATQSLANGWQQEWAEERRKLELFTLDGFLRLRPNLFYKFDLGKAPGRELFPRSPRSEAENTQAGANLRVRMDPTFNVSEEVRLKLQVDALDNILLGSTPLHAGEREFFTLFSDGQEPPVSAVNALKDSLVVKRAYGEVSTPVGILRFGRMGAHWGMGILRNDGDCLDCDFGDNVDRIQFVTEPFSGFYVTPMVEFNSEGATRALRHSDGEPVDLTNADDSHSWVLAVARRDTPQQVRAKLDNNLGVLNYGLHFIYRQQRWAAIESGPVGEQGRKLEGFVPRDGSLYIPDLWLRYEQRTFRVEVELAAVYGTIGNRALDVGSANEPGRNQSLRILQFGAVAQGEYKLLEGKLNLGLELGVASGDKAPGFGSFPARRGSGEGGAVQPGDIEGPQFNCGTSGCPDDAIRNFRFNRAYRVDLILWRELLGGITDAAYLKPSVKYSLADGFDLHGSLIYSQALYAQSTPSTTSRSLGLEANVGARYETEDGFVAGLTWAIFFPMEGLQENDVLLRREFETAQALRGMLGIRF